jgi:hypothetical protein
LAAKRPRPDKVQILRRRSHDPLLERLLKLMEQRSQRSGAVEAMKKQARLTVPCHKDMKVLASCDRLFRLFCLFCLFCLFFLPLCATE